MSKMLHSIQRGQGYFRIDNSCSGGGREEGDMMGCHHCQRLIKRTSWKQEVGYCFKCDAPVCDPCLERMKTHGCEPFLRQFLAVLEDQYRRDQNSKILGV